MLLYVYPKCSTCKDAIKFLHEHHIQFEERDIIKTSPSVAELKSMLAFQKGNLKKLFNTSGDLYRSMQLSQKLPEMSEVEALALLSSHGMLVKRPFLLGNTYGLLGFKKDEWASYLANHVKKG